MLNYAIFYCFYLLYATKIQVLKDIDTVIFLEITIGEKIQMKFHCKALIRLNLIKLNELL